MEVVGNAAKVLPAQTDGGVLNVGTVFAGFTLTVKVVVEAHCPAFGVNV